MSDNVEITFPSAGEREAARTDAAADPAVARRDNLAKARAVRAANRTAAVRTAVERTEGDAARVGVASNPAPVARAEMAREPTLPEETLQRRPRAERTFGAFELPEYRKKPGRDYQFMVLRVLNEPVDRSDLRSYEGDGAWRPEKARDWPELTDPNDPPDAPVEIRGQRLYSRPMAFTIQAKQEDLAAANEQQARRMTSTANGRGANGDEGMSSNGLTRVVPVEIKIEGVAG